MTLSIEFRKALKPILNINIHFEPIFFLSQQIEHRITENESGAQWNVSYPPHTQKKTSNKKRDNYENLNVCILIII